MSATEGGGSLSERANTKPTPEWAKKGVTIVRVPGEKPREFPDYQDYLKFMRELPARLQPDVLADVYVARRA